MAGAKHELIRNPYLTTQKIFFSNLHSMQEKITHLFCDLGGVLLSNGWDRFARARATELFQLEGREVEERHKLYFHTYEIGKLTSDE